MFMTFVSSKSIHLHHDEKSKKENTFIKYKSDFMKFSYNKAEKSLLQVIIGKRVKFNILDGLRKTIKNFIVSEKFYKEK